MLTLLDLLRSLPARGDKTAMIYRTGVRRRVYSYERLYELSLKMNSWFSRNGIENGDRVLLWGPNSPWWSIAFWGCVARGAVIVPVDFMSGKDRAENIAGLTGAKLAIQSRHKPERLTDLPSLLMEDLEEILNDMEALEPVKKVFQDDIAQIIYTSGTTGNPKGVVLTHRNLMTNLRQVNCHIPVVGHEFVFLSLLPLSHMFEQMGGFFTPLYRGASIVFLQTLKPSAIMEALREEDIFAVIAVPRLLQLLKGSIEHQFYACHLGGVLNLLLSIGGRVPPRARKILFHPVRKNFGRHFALFVSGGAALAPDDFRFWSAMGFVVIEGYGLTETAPVLAANTMVSQLAGSVGKAVPGVEIKIEKNEIFARGGNVFPGYYQNEQATTEAFTADGWFRTGDLGELDGEGNLYIKGRCKELIVTGAGINVYPDEIERILDTVSGVRESCVIGLDRGSGEEVHAVILPDGSGRKPDEIISEANDRLDTLHQITGYSLWPESEFPKTTTLKIRKFQVKEKLMAHETPPPEISMDPFINLIARATGTAAGVIHEDSLLVGDLGLTSIGRLELVNYLEQEFRLDLEESAIDQGTRVADLRKLVSGREKIKSRKRYRFWTNKPIFRFVRRVLDKLLHYPLLRLFVTLQVTGLDRLQKVESPVLFISNHLSYLDYAAVMFSLPEKWRYTTATAAWEEFFFPGRASLPMKLWKRFAYEYGTMVLNLFPLPQTGGFRQSFRYMGKLADMGQNILLFPEGQRSRDGRLLPLRRGLGLMVMELRIPVVPVHIAGMEKVYPPGSVLPSPGHVRVSIGEPMFFTKQSADEIVESAKNALHALGNTV